MTSIQKYIYRGKTAEELVEKRMRQCNTIQIKTTQTLLRDPES